MFFWGSILSQLLVQAELEHGSLEFLGVLYKNRIPVCSGVMYTPRVFLTAATCFSTSLDNYYMLPSASMVIPDPKPLRFPRLRDNAGVLQRRVKVHELLFHHSYRRHGKSAYNIVVGALKSYNHTHTKTYHLAELDEYNVGFLSLWNLTLIGWSKPWSSTDAIFGLPPASQAIVGKPTKCSYPRQYFPEAEICPISPEENPDLCNYYFGTPLILQGSRPVMVVALKAWAGSCQLPHQTESYIRTYAIFSWVEDFITNLT
ncbi:Transmembrane protease serine 11D [Entomophthora muscae]|uniref:Transmembrane protease serine 11D n=1 Tax=Entomophthora muscae TaxID=34485 RepID=A0ACC2RYH7_9FUNG|nr:Transmembrane protease serine 11D [Entomophthora muscae]